MSTSYVDGVRVTDEPGASPEIPQRVDIKEAPRDTNTAQVLQADPYRDYFRTDRFDREANERISFITSHLKMDGESDQDVLNRIHRIERRLGSPNIGQTRLNQIYGYVKMALAVQSTILGEL